MFEKIKSKVNSIAISGSVLTMTALSAIPAHAEGEDVTAITTAISSGISDTKTQFLAILAVAVGGAMAFFAIKYAVNQGIGFFSKISKKG